jgi:hypothetical protein
MTAPEPFSIGPASGDASQSRPDQRRRHEDQKAKAVADAGRPGDHERAISSRQKVTRRNQAAGESRSSRLDNLNQYASALRTSPPFLVPSACQDGGEIELLMNFTDPSQKAVLEPPGWREAEEITLAMPAYGRPLTSL